MLVRMHTLDGIDLQGQPVHIAECEKDALHRFILSWNDEPGICGDALAIACAFVALVDQADLRERLTF